MPVEGITQRWRELGRLKFGEDAGDRPVQLKTWRLTSPSPYLIESAAALWGGAVAHHPDGSAEVVTEASALEVLLPPQDLEAGQWYELWGGGGLKRRCTGVERVEPDPRGGGLVPVGPCECDPAKRECKLRTVLRVLLPQLPDLGVWRLSTGSAYAASELPPAVSAILDLSGGGFAAAVLGLESRTTKRPGQKPHHYVVPTLAVRATLAEALTRGQADASPQLPPGSQTPTTATPQPQALPASEDPAPDVSNPENGAVEDDVEDMPRSAEPPAPDPYDELAKLLTSVDLSDRGQTFDELLDYLDTLEARMVAARLWKPGAIDVSATKYLPDGWRAGTMTAELRRFATRATLSAISSASDHDHARAAMARADTKERP